VTRTTLDGSWRPIAAWVDGQVLPVRELRVARLVLAGGHYQILDRGDRVIDSGDYLIDASVVPRSMDIIGVDGPNAGRTMQAIFEQDGDLLTVCYDLDGAIRPETMEPSEAVLLLMITYARTAVQPRH